MQPVGVLIRRTGIFGLVLACCLLQACSTPPAIPMAQRLDALLPADVILFGEQHDAPEHQALERALVAALAQRGQLALLAMEMAEQGQSTAALARNASEAEVQAALRWDDASWPWKDYGPVVMAAVQSGIPVVGTNLPRSALRAAMANEALDARLSPARLDQQRDNIRSGHCMLLPESQIAPMTRIQIARDAAMAETLMGAAQAGKTALLVAGAGHVLRGLGVPAHLPTTLRLKVVLAVAGRSEPGLVSGADVVWETAPLAPVDHCTDLRQRGMPARDPR